MRIPVKRVLFQLTSGLLIVFVFLFFMQANIFTGRDGLHKNLQKAEASEANSDFYTVKTGDNLTKIAKEHGVDLKDLIAANDLKTNVIHPGQKLVIPGGEERDDELPIEEVPISEINSGSSNSPSPSASQVNIDVRNTDIRDILSALAIKLDVDIFLLDEPGETSFKAQDISPKAALEMLLQKEGLSYLQEGRLMVVGTPDRLESDFFNQMTLTRFNLRYINSENLDALVSQLNIPLQSITVDTNPNVIWAQGVPQSLQKVRELIAAVDRSENADPEVVVSLERFDLDHITANTLTAMINQLNIPLQVVTLGANPDTIWVQGSEQALSSLKELIAKVDLPENVDSQDPEEALNLPLEHYELKHITAAAVQNAANTLGLTLQFLNVDATPQAFWAQGGEQHLEKLDEIIAALDVPDNIDHAQNVFLYRLHNTTPEIIEARFSQLFDFEGVSIETFNFPELGQEILVACPPHIEDEVRRSLSRLDEPRRTVRVPIAAASGDVARNKLAAQREILSELTGISAGKMRLSNNLSGDSSEPYYILWAEETPDNIQKLVDMVDMIGEISPP